MYLFLLLAVAILFWIFYDSITKKEDQKALVPRILAMIGLFAIVPSFIAYGEKALTTIVYAAGAMELEVTRGLSTISPPMVASSTLVHSVG